VWDDSVAPEATIDFDAPHVSGSEVLRHFLTAFGLLGGLLAFITWSDPAARSPTAPRSAVINNQYYLYSLGLVENAEGDE
jgi:hypothetical protein